jgi:hypothetical protein
LCRGQWKAQHGNGEDDKGNRSAEGWQPTPQCLYVILAVSWC